MFLENIEKYSWNTIPKQRIEFLKKELEKHHKEIKIALDNNLREINGLSYNVSEGWLYNQKSVKLFDKCLKIEPPEKAKKQFEEFFWRHHLGIKNHLPIDNPHFRFSFIDIIIHLLKQ